MPEDEKEVVKNEAPKRKAGRPKKKPVVESPVVENDVVKNEEDEVTKLKAELEAAKKELAKKSVVRQAVQAKQVDMKPKKPHVCCEIKSTYANMEAARMAKFYELQDDDGGVLIRCPLSGLSYYARDEVQWPTVNTKVPCNKVNSFFVKFTIVPE